MGHGKLNGDAQHLDAVKGGESGTYHGIAEEEKEENLNEPVKEKSAASEGMINCASEPSAPPLHVGEGMINCTPDPSAPPPQVGSELETTATAAAQPCLPPYSAGPYSSPQLPAGQCATGPPSPYEVPVSPPPYTPLPTNHPQQPLSSAPQQNFVQGVGAQANVQTQGGLFDFLCAVCKHKSKYRQQPEQRISIVKCPKCKEHTVSSMY